MAFSDDEDGPDYGEPSAAESADELDGESTVMQSGSRMEDENMTESSNESDEESDNGDYEDDDDDDDSGSDGSEYESGDEDDSSDGDDWVEDGEGGNEFGGSGNEGSDVSGAEMTDSSNDQCERCPICLSRFFTQDVGTPENCEHNFCLDCIQEWSKNVNTCPVDRRVFVLILVRRSVDGEVVGQIVVKNKQPQDANDDDEDLTFCEVCGRSDREDRLLLCDGCDMGYHLDCLDPPLATVPVEEWFCPECRVENQMTLAGETGILDDEVTRLIEDVAAGNGTVMPRRARLVPRTRQTQRVRRNVQRIRAAMHRDLPQTNDVTPPARQRRKTTVRRRKSRVTRKRKTKTTRRRKTTKTKKSTTSSSTKSKTTSVGTSRRRRRRKKRVKKRGRVKKGTRMSKRSGTVRIPLSATAKGRIAGHLGLKKPPPGHSLPLMRGPSQPKTLNHQRYNLGVPTLQILGNRDEFDPIESESVMDVDGMVLSRRVSHIRGSAHSKSAVIAAKLLATPNSARRIRVEALEVPLASEQSSGFDLLSSILDTQSMFLRHSKTATISRNGKVNIIPQLRHGQESCRQRPANPEQHSGSRSQVQSTTTAASTVGSSGSQVMTASRSTNEENNSVRASVDDHWQHLGGGDDGMTFCGGSNRHHAKEKGKKNEKEKKEENYEDIDIYSDIESGNDEGTSYVGADVTTDAGFTGFTGFVGCGVSGEGDRVTPECASHSDLSSEDELVIDESIRPDDDDEKSTPAVEKQRVSSGDDQNESENDGDDEADSPVQGQRNDEEGDVSRDGDEDSDGAKDEEEDDEVDVGNDENEDMEVEDDEDEEVDVSNEEVASYENKDEIKEDPNREDEVTNDGNGEVDVSDDSEDRATNEAANMNEEVSNDENDEVDVTKDEKRDTDEGFSDNKTSDSNDSKDEKLESADEENGRRNAEEMDAGSEVNDVEVGIDEEKGKDVEVVSEDDADCVSDGDACATNEEDVDIASDENDNADAGSGDIGNIEGSKNDEVSGDENDNAVSVSDENDDAVGNRPDAANAGTDDNEDVSNDESEEIDVAEDENVDVTNDENGEGKMIEAEAEKMEKTTGDENKDADAANEEYDAEDDDGNEDVDKADDDGENDESGSCASNEYSSRVETSDGKTKEGDAESNSDVDVEDADDAYDPGEPLRPIQLVTEDVSSEEGEPGDDDLSDEDVSEEPEGAGSERENVTTEFTSTTNEQEIRNYVEAVGTLFPVDDEKRNLDSERGDKTETTSPERTTTSTIPPTVGEVFTNGVWTAVNPPQPKKIRRISRAPVILDSFEAKVPPLRVKVQGDRSNREVDVFEEGEILSTDETQRHRRRKRHDHHEHHEHHSRWSQQGSKSRGSAENPEQEEGEIIEESPPPRKDHGRARGSAFQQRKEHPHPANDHGHKAADNQRPKIKRNNFPPAAAGSAAESKRGNAVPSRVESAGSANQSEISWKKPSKSTKDRNYRDGKPKDEDKYFRKREIKEKEIAAARKKKKRRRTSSASPEIGGEWKKEKGSTSREHDHHSKKMWSSSRGKPEKREKPLPVVDYREKDRHKEKHKSKHREKHKISSSHHGKEREHHRHVEREVHERREKLDKKEKGEKKEKKKEKRRSTEERVTRKSGGSSGTGKRHEHKKKMVVVGAAAMEKVSLVSREDTPVESKEVYTSGDSIIINVSYGPSTSAQESAKEKGGKMSGKRGASVLMNAIDGGREHKKMRRNLSPAIDMFADSGGWDDKPNKDQTNPVDVKDHARHTSSSWTDKPMKESATLEKERSTSHGGEWELPAGSTGPSALNRKDNLRGSLHQTLAEPWSPPSPSPDSDSGDELEPEPIAEQPPEPTVPSTVDMFDEEEEPQPQPPLSVVGAPRSDAPSELDPTEFEPMAETSAMGGESVQAANHSESLNNSPPSPPSPPSPATPVSPASPPSPSSPPASPPSPASPPASPPSPASPPESDVEREKTPITGSEVVERRSSVSPEALQIVAAQTLDEENSVYDPFEPTRSPSPIPSSPEQPEEPSSKPTSVETPAARTNQPNPPPLPELPPLPVEPEPTERSIVVPKTIPETRERLSPTFIPRTHQMPQQVRMGPPHHPGPGMPMVSMPNVRIPPPNFLPRHANSNMPPGPQLRPIGWAIGRPPPVMYSGGGQPTMLRPGFLPPNLGSQPQVSMNQMGPLLHPSAQGPIAMFGGLRPPHSSGPPPLGMMNCPPPMHPLATRMQIPVALKTHNGEAIRREVPGTTQNQQDVTEVVDMDVDSPYSPGEDLSDPGTTEKKPNSTPVVAAISNFNKLKDKFDMLMASTKKTIAPTPPRVQQAQQRSKGDGGRSHHPAVAAGGSAGHRAGRGRHHAKWTSGRRSANEASKKHIVRLEVQNRRILQGKDKVAGGDAKKDGVPLRLDESQLKILDELPSSAVEMQMKEKFMKKLNRQERVVEEVKLALKPHYNQRHVTKEEYKDILRKSVPKICHNRSGSINPVKIRALVEGYVRKFKYHRKKTSTTTTTSRSTKKT